MTPDERPLELERRTSDAAAGLVEDWRRDDLATRVSLITRIAAAIREAVAAERERLVGVIRRAAVTGDQEDFAEYVGRLILGGDSAPPRSP